MNDEEAIDALMPALLAASDRARLAAPSSVTLFFSFRSPVHLRGPEGEPGIPLINVIQDARSRKILSMAVDEEDLLRQWRAGSGAP